MRNPENAIMSEQILVIKTSELGGLHVKGGFSHDTSVLFDIPGKPLFMDRAAAENDENFKQIIPYSILTFQGTYFFYRRTKAVSEKRLSMNYSLGVGGHINPEDGMSDPLDFFNIIECAREREIVEEFNCRLKPGVKLTGLINDNTSAVSRVHLGIVFEYELFDNTVTPRETLNFESLGFAGIEELRRSQDGFENWSQILISEYLS
jgi:predicted NUDIX family phosphoesterase